MTSSVRLIAFAQLTIMGKNAKIYYLSVVIIINPIGNLFFNKIGLKIFLCVFANNVFQTKPKHFFDGLVCKLNVVLRPSDYYAVFASFYRGDNRTCSTKLPLCGKLKFPKLHQFVGTQGKVARLLQAL